jgi:hypothetical protein
MVNADPDGTMLFYNGPVVDKTRLTGSHETRRLAGHHLWPAFLFPFMSSSVNVALPTIGADLAMGAVNSPG